MNDMAVTSTACPVPGAASGIELHCCTGWWTFCSMSRMVALYTWARDYQVPAGCPRLTAASGKTKVDQHTNSRMPKKPCSTQTQHCW